MVFSFTVPCTSSVVYTPGIQAHGVINLEVDNNSAHATNAFEVQLQDTAGGEWYDYLVDADFNAVNLNVLFTGSNAPYSCPSSAVAHTQIRVGNPNAVRFGVTLASGTGNVIIRGNF